MAFKLPIRLERTVLGIAGFLLIAGTPLCTKYPAFAQRHAGSQYFAFEKPEGTRYETVIDMRKSKTAYILKKQEADSLEITFGIEEPLYDSPGKKKDSINLTPLNQGFSRMVIFYPKGVEISKVEQEAYFFPQEKFVKLVPFSEAKVAKKIFKIGETIIGSITPWFGINPVEDAKDKLIDSSKEKDENMYSEVSKRLENEFRRPYSFENIEFFQAEGIRGNERERKIKTFFDTTQLEGRASARALVRQAMGTSSSEIQIKEWLDIDFFIQGGKLPAWIKKQEIGAESRLSLDSLVQTMRIRRTIDIGVYDPQRKKTIIYSIDGEEFDKVNTKNEQRLKEKEMLSSIENDIGKERFSDQTVVLTEFERGFIRGTTKEFGEFCKEYEKRF
jgi:hypothetical protein